MKSYTKCYLLILGIINMIISIFMFIGATAIMIVGAEAIGFPGTSYNQIIAIGGYIVSILVFVSSFFFFEYAKTKGKDLVKCKKGIIFWNIISMLVYSITIVGFIFMLVSLCLICKYIDELRDGVFEPTMGDGKITATLTQQPVKPDLKTREGGNNIINSKSQIEELSQAKFMKDAGIISDEEYAALRKKILGI